MIRRGFSLLAAATLSILAGCASGPLDPAKLSQIVPGKTTMDEARHILGKPDSMLGSQGHVLIRYSELRTVGIDDVGGQGKFHFSSIDLLVDPAGVIEKMHRYESDSHLQVDRLKSNIMGPDISEASLLSITRGKTTAKTMTDLFGPPLEELLGFNGYVTRRWTQAKNSSNKATFSMVLLNASFDDRDILMDFAVEKGLLPSSR